MAFNTFMADIYRRLKPLGFDAEFVRAVVLPDWWDDSLAEVPANRAWAEMSVARHLGISLPALRDQTSSLSLPPMLPVRLKSATRGTGVAQIRPAIQIAQHLAKLLVTATRDLPEFVGQRSAGELRSQLLSRAKPVTLSSLVEECWNNGIVVAHLSRLPCQPGFRKFDGIVLFVEQRPCILLAEGKDSPPMLAFHLAHELGHLMLEHVRPGTELLADDNLERIVVDDEEDAADRFANELLTGVPEPELKAVYGLTGERLTRRARELGVSLGVDPGAIALIYGRSADRWGAAIKALQALGLQYGAREIIHRSLADHLDLEQLTDSQLGFVEALTLPANRTASLPSGSSA